MSEKEPNYIRESKQLCQLRGMDPDIIPKPKKYMTKEELTTKRKEYYEILSVVSFFSNKLLASLKGTPILVVISDAEGHLLEMVGDETIKSTVKEFGIEIGSLFTQEDTGTNVISLTLQQKHPISLIGKQHYHTFLQEIACYGAVFHYTDENSLLGSVCLMMPITNQNPLFLTMLSHVVDSIERELLLRKQNRILNIMNQIMLSRTRNGIVITDKNGITTEFNSFASDVSGIKKKDVLGRCVYESDLTGTYFRDVLENGKKYENIELKFHNHNGDLVVCLFDAQPIYEEDELVGAFGQFRDITDRYMIEEKYNYLAYHDDLTGLPNRRYFQKEVQAFIKNNDNHHQSLAVFYLDLDRFKVINDTYGHSKGDLLLIEVAKRLSECTDDKIQLARMGGDEFIFIYKGFETKQDIEKKAEKILKIFDRPFVVQSSEIETSASIGIAIYPNYFLTLEEFMVFADNAMYQAKEQGKNGYVIYTDELMHDLSEKITLEADLKNALENGEFILHYQPQICNKSGKLIGVEALIRWNHPRQGLIYPDKFIQIAEETGLITHIGEWVIKQACIQNKKWQDYHFEPIKMSVNLSTQQFLHRNLVDFVKSVINNTGLDPQYLVLEITESMAMDFDHSLHVLQQLKAIGVGISIDDFGTGYSSLSYLKKFPLDYLKIDKSFVRDIMEDINDANIVKAIITLAHNLNLAVIAEGVETQEQLDFLRKHECDQTQGYLYSKPITVEQFENRLRNK
ncbi:EAL domain-containing protein [Metabacillus malikii]|uniref:Diguanylate cyclase (GGDEF)-like protein/PAS domain S-box-containing protein n=1 Tax=Metabacillus malikii TaxID=1504265 RepID=A0ABT9ZDK7_9BACI|nr:EAL domain-containing protein [Metabacillus malikii]MDQ0230341.1 diguanylate cyclase (GGDEF)-like protein/PAS domain S-box-containing protein [Metabacillus malikii]